MIVRPMTDAELAAREEMGRKSESLKVAGICPTCENFQKGGVFPPSQPRTFHENEHVICMLEAYPRNPGHSIILVKRHLEDLTEMDAGEWSVVSSAIQTAVAALKSVLAAEKIYLCSMCDGKRNHLHFQLIPRLPGDRIVGSKLFVKRRQQLVDATDVIEQLRVQMRSTGK